MYLPFIFLYAIGVVTRKSLTELAYFGLIFLIVVLTMRPKKGVFKKLGFLLGFEGFLFILALFNPGKPVLETPIGPITHEGIYSFFMLLGKAFLSAGAALVVTNSVGFSRILAEMEALRFPRILTLTLAFTYRYLDLFVDETTRMKRAVDSRAFGVGRKEYYRKLGSLIGEVFVRAYLRNGRIYRAMLARGFGEFPSLEEPRPNAKTATLALLALGGLLL
ncbi:energy-coupling factor transporter transmembrane component T family protein [Thermococcus thioreducens]|uniref:Cobalt ABC transporter permease n=1 Tax=Thermococcus thioreducens TaxID=277988 RepID=A0A0Q2UQ94_9EURY|nr:energy-coupling factor transporter transmembrane component T [Thermococcus thioreducens]ASJ13499.1 cobalt ABC transporter permease [Thermococcus thioreducens]KQH82856.1 cobalt ABC transporter permease [Thermococcus thioreducens]SEW10793.1 cobalt/nickel transport system permease protein [Thermococcus thioreducens]